MFSSIADRTNGTDIDKDWFNALKVAGINIESFLGLTFIPQTSFSPAASVGSPADLTGFLFDHTNTQSARIYWSMMRDNGSSNLIANGSFAVIYRPHSSAWDISAGSWDGDDTLITFSITASGQLQYILTAMSPAQTSAKLILSAMPFSI